MNESIEASATELPTARVNVPNNLDQNLSNLESEGEPAVKPQREGLPPGFRMRHDKHYVEELLSTSTMGRESVAGMSPRPSATMIGASHVDDRRMPRPPARGLELIAGRLESIVTHTAIVRGEGSSTDLVSRTLDAELLRVSHLARAMTIAERQIEPLRRSVPIGEIAAAIRPGCARIAHLVGMQCVVTTDDAYVPVAVERALVVHGIAGTIDALVDLAHISAIDDSLEDARITVSLQTTKSRPALIVDVACPAVALPGAPADRLFDNTHQLFERAPAAGILLASAAHVVALHGGRIDAHTAGGINIRYVFPF